MPLAHLYTGWQVVIVILAVLIAFSWLSGSDIISVDIADPPIIGSIIGFIVRTFQNFGIMALWALLIATWACLQSQEKRAKAVIAQAVEEAVEFTRSVGK